MRRPARPELTRAMLGGTQRVCRRGDRDRTAKLPRLLVPASRRREDRDGTTQDPGRAGRSLMRVTGRSVLGRGALAVAALLSVAACATNARASSGAAGVTRAPITTTTAAPTAITTTTTAAPPTTGLPPDTTTTTRPHPARVVYEQAWAPFAMVGPVTLRHPSDRVEAIGFHQSGNDGARHQVALPSAARWFVQEDRGRDTDLQGAADVVVEPDREIRAPVTGTVIRAGTYTLYCDKVDQYVVINPDERPGWEVKVLHIEGLAVAKGQRVEAGVTRVAARSRVLPFSSAVNDDTAVPAWPHVQIEVVDPTVPDRPTGPGCP